MVQGIRANTDINDLEKTKPSMTKDVLITIHTLLNEEKSSNGVANEYGSLRSEDKLSSQEVDQASQSKDAVDTSEMDVVQTNTEESSEDSDSSTSQNNKSAPPNHKLTPLT